jgi:hypothetical protein
VLIALVGVGHAIGARAQSGYAGTYQASETTVVAEVTAWGADCGTRPQSHTQRERPTVEVRDVDAQLELRFPDRTLRTNTCWSQNPAVKLTRAGVSGAQWKIECATAPNDPKRETAVYTLTAESPFVLVLHEESSYEWQLKDSRCIATVRTSQRLERPEVAAPTPAASPEGCTPGPLTRLRLRPSQTQIEPGKRVCFTARATDAQGCSVDLDPKALSWSLQRTPAIARGTLATNCFRAADSAAEAEGTFRVVASYQGLRDEASVVVSVPDLSDITARRIRAEPNVIGQDEEAQGAGLAGAGIKALGVRSDNLWSWLLGASALLALAAALTWLVWSRRSAAAATRMAAAPARTPLPTPAAQAKAPAARAVASERPAPAPASPAEQLICPQCRRGFAPGSSVCSADGTALVPYATFLQQVQGAKARTCSACGHHMSADDLFCGACGKRA